MEETKFWKIVDEINWRENCNKTKAELLSLQLLLAYKYSEEEMSAFRSLIAEKAKALSSKIRGYCAINKTSKIPYSEDGYVDLCDHVVGMGKDFYTAANDEPAILEGLQYKRAFAYVPPTMVHYAVFKPGYFNAQVDIFCRKVCDLVKASGIVFDGNWDIIESVVALLRAGEFDKLPSPETIVEACRNVQRQARNAVAGKDVQFALEKDHYLANIVRDAAVYLEITGGHSKERAAGAK